MEIDRKPERLGAGENRPEETVVQVAPAMMAVDDDALEAPIAFRALEFRDRGRRVAGGKRREPEQAVRMAADGLRERVVRLSGDLLRLFAFKLFDAGLRQRQSLHVDARRIHRRDPAVAEVDELGDQVRQPAARPLRALLQPAAGTVQEGGGCEVLFEGDRAHRLSPSYRFRQIASTISPGPNPHPSRRAARATVFGMRISSATAYR